MSEPTLGEVYRLCERIEAQVTRMNGSVREHGEAIAVLLTRADQADRRLNAGRRDLVVGGSGLGVGLVALDVLWHWMRTRLGL